MNEKKKVFLACLSVEGIQKYIFATGRLKEMIGGSEIINKVVTPPFFEKSLPGMNCISPENFACKPDEYVLCQKNAGALRLVFADEKKAREFLGSISARLLAEYPGLPVYGALAPFEWENTVAGSQLYRAARSEADAIIGRKRNFSLPSEGCQLLPILRAARLDGRPAAAIADSQPLSLPSLAKSQSELIAASRARLQGMVKRSVGLKLEWKDNLDEMLQGQGGKVALICMDGNDLGKLFGSWLKEGSERQLAQGIKLMMDLSEKIQNCNEGAFGNACSLLAAKFASSGKYLDASGNLVMPLRPIVLGGDDITIIARAEIALPFIALFTAEFERLAREYGLPLSLGVGMVVMDSSYPFVKAFPLAESLQDSAKNLTRAFPPDQRPSSLDYLVLTEDVEDNEALVRQRLFTGANGERLTMKPYFLRKNELRDFLQRGLEVNSELPRSQLRQAWTICRAGSMDAHKAWNNLHDNISRNLGGRDGKLMRIERFKEIFPDNFFIPPAANAEAGKKWQRTALGDYLELVHLMPDADFLELLQEAPNA